MNINYVDHYFIDTYGMTMIAGKAFTKEMANDEQKYVILNETAVKNIGWTPEEAVGKGIYHQVDYRDREVKMQEVA